MADDVKTWKDIPGYEKKYQASCCGCIRSLDREVVDSKGHIKRYKGKLLRPTKSDNGYLTVMLSNADKKLKRITVHKLVAMTYMGDPNGLEVNHIDSDKHNNTVANLEYCSRSENIRHRLVNSSGKDRMLPSMVKEIRELLGVGASVCDIASKLGVSKYAITQISKGNSWSYLL